jgi:hypothetical protein
MKLDDSGAHISPAICPHPDPTPPPPPCLKSSHITGSTGGLFPSCFPTKASYAFLISTCVPHVPPISSYLVTYVNTNYERPTQITATIILSQTHFKLYCLTQQRKTQDSETNDDMHFFEFLPLLTS